MTDIITGTLAALMGFGTLLYSYRKWVQKKPGNLRIHITLGILCITVCLIHIGSKFADIHISTGFIAFFSFLICVAAGSTRRYFTNKKIWRALHLTSASTALLALVFHIGKTVIYALVS